MNENTEAAELDDVAERLADIARDIARIEDITPPEALERLHQALLGPVYRASLAATEGDSRG